MVIDIFCPMSKYPSWYPVKSLIRQSWSGLICGRRYGSAYRLIVLSYISRGDGGVPDILSCSWYSLQKCGFSPSTEMDIFLHLLESRIMLTFWVTNITNTNTNTDTDSVVNTNTNTNIKTNTKTIIKAKRIVHVKASLPEAPDTYSVLRIANNTSTYH